MFDLQKPCQNCPFRKGQGSRYKLSKKRLDEIFEASAFQCHKTLDKKPQQCACLMKLLAKGKRPNQIMQVAERLGRLDISSLDPDNEVYTSLDGTVKAHTQGIEQEDKNKTA